jgi:hypothetical protein
MGKANATDISVAMAQQKSYVGAAITTFVAYLFFWLPGVIFNIMYINDARRMQKIAGRGLPGVGCLWILLIVNLGWLFALCSLITSLGILG